jgi:mono/diheme cytochrome c family protein
MRYSYWKAGLALAGAIGLCVSVSAQQPQADKPKVQTATVQPNASVEGRDNFVEYCAVCHGLFAKGDGPAAPAMKAKVPDLTILAQKTGGKLNKLAMQDTIVGTKKQTPAHGSVDMPIWGPVFRSMNADPNIAKLRVQNLVDYIESIQVK